MFLQCSNTENSWPNALRRKTWLLEHLAPGVNLEFPNPKWLPGFQSFRGGKIKWDVPLFATKYKTSQLWVTKPLHVPPGTHCRLHRPSIMFSGGGAFSVQLPTGVWIHRGNVSSFTLMFTKYVAGVYLPIILSLFLFLKRLSGPKIWTDGIGPSPLFYFKYLGFLFSFYLKSYAHDKACWGESGYLPPASIPSSPRAAPPSLLAGWCPCCSLFIKNI